jgi:hypothetical protein
VGCSRAGDSRRAGVGGKASKGRKGSRGSRRRICREAEESGDSATLKNGVVSVSLVKRMANPRVVSRCNSADRIDEE